MAWERPVGQSIIGVLRNGVRASMLIAGIMLSVLLVYVVFKFSVFFADFLDRTIFSRPW